MAQRRDFVLGALAFGTGIAGLGSPILAAAPAAPAIARHRAKADRILVFKRKRTLQLLLDQDVLVSFRVALGRQPRGPKERRGDLRTPEGSYEVAGFNPGSYFYRAIAVSYPNAEDRARARAMGVPPGGDIAIHGLDPAIAAKWREEHWMFNWTRGCIAVTNREMDQIWDRVALGTPIEIQP